MGLSAPFKELPPKYFYDERGSQLFEQITELPEYYPTRAERAILDARAREIVEVAGTSTLIELGSGSAAKTRCLFDAMRDADSLEAYVPVDISEEITRETAVRLIDEYDGLRVHGVVCDYDTHLERIPREPGGLIAFLGGTIGNFNPNTRRSFLARIASLMYPEDRFLLGTDLVKERARLEAAYNDSAGVTAEFNKNVLHVLNRELDADFDPAGFEHHAFWDEINSWIDIRLRSLADQTVTSRRSTWRSSSPTRRRCAPRSPRSSRASSSRPATARSGSRSSSGGPTPRSCSRSAWREQPRARAPRSARRTGPGW